MRLLPITVVSQIVLCGSAFAVPDPDFGSQGIGTVMNATWGRLNGLAVDTLHRSHVVGTFANGSNGPIRMFVARLSARGVLDPSFCGGMRELTPKHELRHLTSVAVDAGARTLIAGDGFEGFTGGILAMRLAQDGAVDTTFAEGGEAWYTHPLCSSLIASSMSVQSDQTLLIVAHCDVSYDRYVPALLRVRNDGAVDSAFGDRGIAFLPFPARNPAEPIVTRDMLGRFLVASRSNTSIHLTRLQATGHIDPTFGEGTGTVSLPFDGEYPRGLRHDPIDDKIHLVLAGEQTATGQSGVSFVRFDRDGDLDSTFNLTGVLHTDAGSVLPSAFAYDTEGRWVASGSTRVSPEGDVALGVARFTIDGVLDSSFGVSGVEIVPDTVSDYGPDLVLQSDGKILVIDNRPGSPDTFLGVLRLIPET